MRFDARSAVVRIGIPAHGSWFDLRRISSQGAHLPEFAGLAPRGGRAEGHPQLEIAIGPTWRTLPQAIVGTLQLTLPNERSGPPFPTTFPRFISVGPVGRAHWVP